MSNNMILLVDHDLAERRAMQATLEAEGYDTCLAYDALSCVSEARRHQPNAIVLDLALPGGDGFVAIQQIKRHPSLSVIPIIVIAARDDTGNRERAIKAGAKVFLQKPVDSAELMAILRQILGQPTHPGDAGITGKWKRTA